MKVATLLALFGQIIALISLVTCRVLGLLYASNEITATQYGLFLSTIHIVSYISPVMMLIFFAVLFVRLKKENP